jgi:hypothetical protein
VISPGLYENLLTVISIRRGEESRFADTASGSKRRVSTKIIDSFCDFIPMSPY